jgi:rubrerythrin
MSHSDFPEQKVLDAAIDLEEKGHKFFKESAAKTDNLLAREVFEYLSTEELNHLKAIKSFGAGYVKGQVANTDSLIQSIKDHKSPADLIFAQIAKAAPLEGDELDVYKFALDFEIKSEKFYIKAESEATDPAAKKLYGFLIGEERRHGKIIESCLAYFENPAEFFHQREKWHFEA